MNIFSSQVNLRRGSLAAAALGMLVAGCATMADQISLGVAPTAGDQSVKFTCERSSSGRCLVIRGPGPAIALREGTSQVVPNLAVGSPYCFAVRGDMDWKRCNRYVVKPEATTHALALT